MSLRSEAAARPDLYWHDRFLILQESRALLEALAQARCLEEFGHAHSRAVLLFDYVFHTTFVMPTEETTREIFQSDLVGLLTAATSNGLKQLDQQWESPAVADPKFLASLQAVSMLCHTTWLLVASHPDAVQLKLHSRALDTGLLPTLVPMCNRLLPILHSLQQPADQLSTRLSSSQWDVVVLAQSLLDMWIGLCHTWPSPALHSTAITATVEPVAKISLSLLRIPAAAGNKGSCGSNNSSAAIGDSSSSSSDSSSGSHWDQYCMMCMSDCGTSRSLKVALRFAMEMVVLHKEDDNDDTDDDDVDDDDFLIGDSSSRAPAWCWSIHVQQLLLAYLAAVAAAKHSKVDQAEASPTAMQQQQITKHHLKLLASVHVPATALTKRLEAAAQGAHTQVHLFLTNSELLAVTPAVVYLLEHLDYRTRQGDAAAKARLERWSAPVVLTCQELLLLGDKSLPTVGRAFNFVWAAVMATYKHVEQAGLVEVLRQLLQSLYPVAIEGFKQYTDGRSIAALRQMHATEGQSKDDPKMISQQLIDQWLMITCLMIQDVDEDDLTAIILQKPLEALAAVEAAVRGSPAATMCFPVVSAFTVASFTLMTLPAVVTRLTSRTMDSTTERKVQKQLLSLLCSCYKVAADTTRSRKGVEPASVARTLLHASVAACALLRWVQRGPPAGHQTAVGPANSSSRVGLSSMASTSGSATQQRTADSRHEISLQGNAIIGRGMFAAGKLMEQENSDIATVLLVTRCWITGFDSTCDHDYHGAVRKQLSLQLPGDLVAAAAAKQEVQQKLDNLIALLKADDQLNDSGKRTSQHQCTAPQVARQLQDFGAFLCGAVPLELCCNNPSCRNLVKLCELELVAGKGSRCSACKVARYCSKDCQKEHWKQHKAACKRVAGLICNSNWRELSRARGAVH